VRDLLRKMPFSRPPEQTRTYKRSSIVCNRQANSANSSEFKVRVGVESRGLALASQATAELSARSYGHFRSSVTEQRG